MNAFSLPVNVENAGADSGNTDAVIGVLCVDSVSAESGTETPKIDKGLSLRQRVRKTSDYKDAFEEKCSFVGKFIVMLQRHGDDSALRVGVIASKRTLRRAVDRNRAKRLMREAYRLNRYMFYGKLDVVLIARRPIAKASITMVEKDLIRLARKAGMLI